MALLDPSIFAYLEASIEQDALVRESLSNLVARLDRSAATTSGLLARVHSTPRSSYPPLVAQVEDAVRAQAVVLGELGALASQHPYYKHHQKWSRAVQSTIYTTLLCAWLGGFAQEDTQAQGGGGGAVGRLLSLQQVGEVLGAPVNLVDRDAFHLSVEEYLLALTDLTQTLARLATNAVTLGDTQLPLLISGFVKDLLAGFQLLNLKNDVLRKRADAVKYDVKRVEDVVYDLTLRGLVARPEPQPAP